MFTDGFWLKMCLILIKFNLLIDSPLILIWFDISELSFLKHKFDIATSLADLN